MNYVNYDIYDDKGVYLTSAEGTDAADALTKFANRHSNEVHKFVAPDRYYAVVAISILKIERVDAPRFRAVKP